VRERVVEQLSGEVFREGVYMRLFGGLNAISVDSAKDLGSSFHVSVGLH
jgi:hypothetical protein